MSPTGAVIATYKLCLAYVSIPIVETGQVHLSLSFSHILCLSVGMVGRKSRLSLGSRSPHQLAPGRPVSTPRSRGAPGRACTPPVPSHRPRGTESRPKASARRRAGWRPRGWAVPAGPHLGGWDTPRAAGTPPCAQFPS